MQAKKMGSGRGNVYLVKIGGKPALEMEVRTFARIKKVIWDQLLATKAEIIQSKLYFRPGGGGGTRGISGWGCAAGTLKPLAYTRASSG